MLFFLSQTENILNFIKSLSNNLFALIHLFYAVLQPHQNMLIPLLLLSFLTLVHGIIDFHETRGRPIPTNFSGPPLFLTSLLESGHISEARNLSSVKPLVGDVKSFSGFFTVNKTYNSNIFFWFFPSEVSYETAPVLVWLQGGPGGSSMFGLFAENGPYELKNDLNVTLRKYSWTKKISVLYIDNPVGTGYSFTDSKSGYARNEVDVGINLYETVRQFFIMFPKLAKNDFYISGESYAGKYVPALAYTIYVNNEKAPVKINLKGVAIGNGLCDPVHMLNFGDYLFQIGLIDANGRNAFMEKSAEIKKLIEEKQYRKAFMVYDEMLNNDFGNTTSLFTNLTGYTNYFNYLFENSPSFDYVGDFIQQDYVREAIHVGNLSYHLAASDVEQYLIEDLMQSVAPWIEILLENYKMLFYSGQLDIIVAYPLTVEFITNLKWSGAEKYKTAERYIWKVEDQIAGYYKTVNNLNEVLVLKAGHLVPSEQPSFAFDLINRFVFNDTLIPYL